METDLINLSKARDAARKSLEGDIRQLWRNPVFHIAQVQKLTGLPYKRLRLFLNGSRINFTDSELVGLHDALSKLHTISSR